MAIEDDQIEDTEALDEILKLLEKRAYLDRNNISLNNIIEKLREKKNKKQKAIELERLCFIYLMDSKKKVLNREGRREYGLVFSLLSGINKRLAKQIKKEVNEDRVVNYIFSTYTEMAKEKAEPVKPFGGVVDTALGEFENFELEPVTIKAEDDPRLMNLKQIYSQLTSKQADSCYNKDEKEYAALLDSIDHTLQYAKKIDGKTAKKEVLKVMLEDNEFCAVNYLKDVKPFPEKPVDRLRQELALATVLAVNKELGNALVYKINEERKKIIEGLKKEEPGSERLVKLLDVEKLSVQDIARHTKLDTTLSFDEKLDSLKKEMREHQRSVNDTTNRTDYRYVHLAEYVTRRIICEKMEKLKGDAAKNFEVSKTEIKNSVEKLLSSKAFFKIYNEFAPVILRDSAVSEPIIDCDKFYKLFRGGVAADKSQVEPQKRALQKQKGKEGPEGPNSSKQS